MGTEWAELLRLLPGYDPFRSPGDAWFDEGRAADAVAFIEECLCHVEGDKVNQPFLLEPWQKAFVGNLFGWLRTDERGRTVRRYREALLYVPRKNGKTPLTAAIALLVFFCDDEAGQQDYVAAADKEQAGMLFRQAKGMVEREPELKARCRVYGGNAAAGQSRSIFRESDASFLRVVSADAEGRHGGNSHLVVIDELHAQPDRSLVDVLTTSTASLNRKQPLTLYVTTADFDRPSICNEKHDYACKVRDGAVDDPGFLPCVYEAAPGDDWTSREVWAKANPNLGVSVSEEYLARECEKAQRNPSLENTFRRLHLNQKTQTDVRWLPAELWARGNLPVDAEALSGLPCWAGLDFGWRDDYAALVLVFNGGDRYQVLCWFWLPESGRRDRRAEPTATFVAEGLVSLTPGEATDVEAIYEALRECRRKYDLRAVCLDPNNARKQGQDLMEEGFEVYEFYQSKKNYNEPCRLLESLLKEGRIAHGGNKVLSWMAGNAAAEMDGLGQMMPKKKKSAEKIDGVCALAMALGRAMLESATSGGSVEFWE